MTSEFGISPADENVMKSAWQILYAMPFVPQGVPPNSTAERLWQVPILHQLSQGLLDRVVAGELGHQHVW